MSLLNLLMAFAMAQAAPNETTQVKTELPEKQGKLGDLKYDLNLEIAFESFQSKRESQRRESLNSLQNLALGAGVIINDNLSFYAELLGEQNFDNTNVFFGEVYVDYTPEVYRGLNLQVGNMYYNYGLLVQQEAVLARRPSYYNDLLVTRRGIDLGATVAWQPLQSLPLTVSYSQFAGRTQRAGDGRNQQAEINPQVINLTYSPSFLTATLSRVERQYQLSPRFTATGLSVKAKPIKLGRWSMTSRPMAEFWELNYNRVDGFEQNGQAFLLGHKFAIHRFFHRWLYSSETWRTSIGGPTIQPEFQLNGIGFNFSKYFYFEYQNIKSIENQPGLSLTNADADVYRVYFQL